MKEALKNRTKKNTVNEVNELLSIVVASIKTMRSRNLNPKS